MFENKLISGIIFTLGGVIYLFSLFKRRKTEGSGAWELSMIFKGLVGGIAFIAIGIVSLMMHFGIL